MSQPLRILLLEDDPADAALIQRELRRQSLDCIIDRVDNREEFTAQFQQNPPDLVLSDHRLAAFSGMHALELIRTSTPDLPFIFVTGALDEETAVECLKAGAWDYVLKDRLVRLGPAVAAAMELRRTRTALRDSQEQLLHTQRMDALGRLAGSVAHDYNNLMTAVVGYASLVAETMDGDPRKEDIDEIRLAGERAVSLTRQLLAFSRKQVMTVTALRLNDVVTGMERLLRRLLGDRITLDLELAPELPSIDADPSQLEQVIMNLAVNAGDAMPSGGRLTIRTSAVVLDEGHRARHTEAEIGPHVLLLVRDGGGGIPPDVLPRIFEPFFTTKPRGRGTGLGLATVYGAVRQWNGHIAVSSAVGAGTEFRIYLPVGSDRAALVRPAMPRKTTSLAGTETVVLVESDDLVRALARRVLGSRGYHVIEARNRGEALRVLEGAATVDLLLADTALPDGDGRDLAALVTASRPGVRVLVTSALLEREPSEIPEQGDAERPRYPMLSKPYTPVGLLERVRDVLQEAPSA
jgi:two-component system cell cycle sensor histidine kinase/response regulator CckA